MKKFEVLARLGRHFTVFEGVTDKSFEFYTTGKWTPKDWAWLVQNLEEMLQRLKPRTKEPSAPSPDSQPVESKTSIIS